MASICQCRFPDSTTFFKTQKLLTKIFWYSKSNSLDVATRAIGVSTVLQFAKSKILAVRLGTPIQENWIRLNRDPLDVIMPEGAIIDRLAGIILDCPVFLFSLGLE